MTVKDLKFRFYKGEEECPEKYTTKDEQRWWHQESTVAKRPELACKDIEERPEEEWPIAIKDAPVPKEDKAVALSGYLNTKQWGDVAANFFGYFDAPVNDFRV